MDFDSNNNNDQNTENQNIDEHKVQMQDYDNIESRLKEIEEKISNNDLDMEESLKLYEEAVSLGMKASKTVENNVLANSYTSNDEENNPE